MKTLIDEECFKDDSDLKNIVIGNVYSILLNHLKQKDKWYTLSIDIINDTMFDQSKEIADGMSNNKHYMLVKMIQLIDQADSSNHWPNIQLKQTLSYLGAAHIL